MIALISALVLLSPGMGLSQDHPRPPPATNSERNLVGPVNHADRTETPSRNSDRSSTLNWETREGRSYLIPAAEILAYLFLLNQFDRHFTDSKWVLDNDQFSVNQFLHPYSGSVYFGLARSSGLNFWKSSLYSVAGSFLWEIGGEKTNPSINDMIATPIGGTFLGEPLFRMTNLLLESDGGARVSGANSVPPSSRRPLDSIGCCSVIASTPSTPVTAPPRSSDWLEVAR
ncbi:MAG: DUF3943 domain-containing protein [Nitrospira sp.]|nr:DUF3943 domain-containing protein [Nitrospira sp.]